MFPQIRVNHEFNWTLVSDDLANGVYVANGGSYTRRRTKELFASGSFAFHSSRSKVHIIHMIHTLWRSVTQLTPMVFRCDCDLSTGSVTWILYLTNLVRLLPDKGLFLFDPMKFVARVENGASEALRGTVREARTCPLPLLGYHRILYFSGSLKNPKLYFSFSWERLYVCSLVKAVSLD